MHVNKFSDLKMLRVNPRIRNCVSYYIYTNKLYPKKGYQMKKLSDVINFMYYNPGLRILLMSKPLRITKSGILRKTGKFSSRVCRSCGGSEYNKFSNRGEELTDYYIMDEKG